MARVCLLSLVLLLGVPAGEAAAGRVFVVVGHGWGHGVGMSQYGAEGFARHGWDHRRILAHYYRGTTLRRVKPGRIRVLLAQGSRVRISSRKPFRVTGARGKAFTLAARAYVAGPALRFRSGERTLSLSPPVRFDPGARPLVVNGVAYRGSVVVDRVGRGVRAVNDVHLERYLRGVVPREMPHRWSRAALEAQAVAARSYAIASRRPGRPFDVDTTTRTQVYGGIPAERPSTNRAVGATAGLVVTWRGRVAHTFFHSTSGGRTAAVQDVWPRARRVPYLASVPDPYDSISPHHTWGPFVFTERGLARRLGVARLDDVVARASGSGRVTAVETWARGRRRSVPVATVRARLNLRSSMFTVAVLSLSSPDRSLVFGRPSTLSGTARGAPGARLEFRRAPGRWRATPPLRTGPAGRFSVSVRPPAATTYRLVAGGTTCCTVHVAVTPDVRLRVAEGRLAGVVRPRLSARAVAIERWNGRRWAQLGQARLVQGKRFEALVQLEAGRYRARVRGSDGLAAAASPPVTVPAPG